MNEEPRKKGFWETWLAMPGQRAVAVILAFTLFFCLETLAVMAGMALVQHRYELSGGISDMFKIVLGGIGGSLATYLGMRKNGESDQK